MPAYRTPSRASPNSLNRAYDTIAEALHTRAGEIQHGFVEDLRSDPVIPVAKSLRKSQVSDHVGAFLADIADCLGAIGDAGTDDVLEVADGRRISRLLAELHGMQRADLGWTEDGISREYELLRQRIRQTLEREGSSLGRWADRVFKDIDSYLSQAAENARITLKARLDGTADPALENGEPAGGSKKPSRIPRKPDDL
jgi:hypothetical protein